jgi:hypothetical protein
MIDLLDIAPSTAVDIVKLGEDRIKVYGITISTMASIISQFPDLKKLASGGGDDSIALLISGCGAAIGPIIAAGCGHHGDEKYEQAAARLQPAYQLKLLRAILGLTFPNGIGSFVTEMTELMGAVGGAKKPTFRLRSRQSPSTSSQSVDASESHQTMQ